MPVKILLADKSITIQKVVEMLFSGRDYEVVCVSDGETALSEADRVAPDVVLVDVDLPRIDGYRFADRLKKTPAFAQTPVILMMSRDDVYDSAKGKQSGILDNIAKPFESQELISKVKKAIGAAPTRPSAPAAPRPAAETRPAAPPPPAPAPPPAAARPAAQAKSAAPTDIFSIISEAPSQEYLKQAAAPEEEVSVYEVEPEVEEVEEPIARELSSALPVGPKAVEEMRAGMGLTQEPEEVQPEVVTFESFDLSMGAAEQETPRAAQPVVPAAPRTEQPPVQTPLAKTSPQPSELSASDMWSVADEAVTKIAKDLFATMPQARQSQVSDDKLKGMVEETVARMVKEAVGSMPGAQQTALPEKELRSIAEETISKMALDVFKDMAPPIPKISEETVRRGIEDAVMKIAREVARDVIEKVAWEVIPELAEHLIKAEIERLKAEP